MSSSEMIFVISFKDLFYFDSYNEFESIFYVLYISYTELVYYIKYIWNLRIKKKYFEGNYDFFM